MLVLIVLFTEMAAILVCLAFKLFLAQGTTLGPQSIFVLLWILVALDILLRNRFLYAWYEANLKGQWSSRYVRLWAGLPLLFGLLIFIIWIIAAQLNAFFKPSFLAQLDTWAWASLLPAPVIWLWSIRQINRWDEFKLQPLAREFDPHYHPLGEFDSEQLSFGSSAMQRVKTDNSLHFHDKWSAGLLPAFAVLPSLLLMPFLSGWLAYLLVIVFIAQAILARHIYQVWLPVFKWRFAIAWSLWHIFLFAIDILLA